VDNLIIGGGVIGLAFLRTNEILAEFTADERALLDQIFNGGNEGSEARCKGKRYCVGWDCK
ncbi:2_t:CDS:1, partial [Paraglomus occultum]